MTPPPRMKKPFFPRNWKERLFYWTFIGHGRIDCFRKENRTHVPFRDMGQTVDKPENGTKTGRKIARKKPRRGVFRVQSEVFRTISTVFPVRKTCFSGATRLCRHADPPGADRLPAFFSAVIPLRLSGPHHTIPGPDPRSSAPGHPASERYSNAGYTRDPPRPNSRASDPSPPRTTWPCPDWGG